MTIEEHILLDKQLDGNPININRISKNLNKSIEEVNAQIQEFIYIIYIKKITKKIVKKTIRKRKTKFYQKQDLGNPARKAAF